MVQCSGRMVSNISAEQDILFSCCQPESFRHFNQFETNDRIMPKIPSKKLEGKAEGVLKDIPLFVTTI